MASNLARFTLLVGCDGGGGEGTLPSCMMLWLRDLVLTAREPVPCALTPK